MYPFVLREGLLHAGLLVGEQIGLKMEPVIREFRQGKS